jgi:hypothetical protein
VKEKHTENSDQIRRIWPLWASLAGIIGLAIYFSGYPAAERFGPEAIIVRFCQDVGIALVISAIVALVLERLVHESLLSRVHNAIEIIKKGSDVLQGAGELQIEDIVARRRGLCQDRWEHKVQNAIEEQLSKESGEILISCVAAPDFFLEGTKIGKTLWDNLTNPKNKCNLRTLLLCPKSEWARLRSKLEPGHPTMQHIRISAEFLHALKSKSGDKVKFKCYDFPPTVFLILTDKLAFVEAYPMIRLKHGEGPIGGVSPVLLVRSDTETYKRWKGHFEFIWKEKSINYEDHHRLRSL